MSFIHDWIGVILQLLTLGAIAISAIKVIDRNIDEWKTREQRLSLIEQRLTKMETELDAMRNMGRDIASILAKQTDTATEIERLRNRLDRFLDARGVQPT